MQWADPSSKLTWKDINSEIVQGGDLSLVGGTIANKRFADDVRAVLILWRDAIQRQKDWKLRLIEGAAEPGFGPWRRVWVSNVGELTTLLEHKWTADEKHDYSLVGDDKRQLGFTWEPDQSIMICVEFHRVSKIWPNLIRTNMDFPFSGPLAIWRMNRIGKTESDYGTLTFEIEDCPGPPRDVFPRPIEELINETK